MLDLASGFCFYTFRKLVEVGGNGITMWPNRHIRIEQNYLQEQIKYVVVKQVVTTDLSTLNEYSGTLLISYD